MGREVVVVTGSSGLIGSALIHRLADRFDLVGLDREGPPHPPAHADCVFVDLTSDESVQNAFTAVQMRHGDRIASVVHLAAYYDFSGAPSPMYDEVTVRGTERLLRELGRFHVGQFIFASTMLVHAPCLPDRKIDEDWPLQPKWQYPQSKVRTEQLIHEKRGAVPSLILRIAGVYDATCHSIPIAHQIQRIYERQLIGRFFPGDPSHGQSFVHLHDVVEALALGIERRADLGPETTLLIGEPEAVPYAELQREFGLLLHGKEWKTRRVPRWAAKAGSWLQDLVGDPFIKPWMIDLADDHYELDVRRAREALGWQPRHRLREALAPMVDSLKKDPIGWYRENHLQPPAWVKEVGDSPPRDPRGEIPPGWTYNPSGWSQRIPISVAAMGGFFIAAYLALYQYRIIPGVWEPFFGRGSEIILDSPLSRVLPVSDAALGAFGYLLDAISGIIGGRARWRTMPWMVILFGILVGPLGAVSIALVIAQPVAYGAWCTLCIASAAISIVMIGPAMDEVLASVQHLKRTAGRGRKSMWRAFWGRPVEPHPA